MAADNESDGVPGPGSPHEPGAGWPPPGPPLVAARSRGRTAGIVALVLLLVAGGITGYVLLIGGSDSGGSGSSGEARPAEALEQRWTTKLPDMAVKGTGTGLPALWSTTDAPVYADTNGVRAFDRTTGKKLWTLKTPRGASEICALGGPSPNGVGAAVFDSGGDSCSFLSVFDTDTGRTLWSKNLKGTHSIGNPRVAVNDDVVITDIDGVRTYDVSGGAKKWTLRARGQDCGHNVVFSATHLAVSSRCSDTSPEDLLTVRGLRGYDDTETYPKEHREVRGVIGDAPLTLMLEDEYGRNFLQTYTDEGDPDRNVPMTGKLGELQFGATGPWFSEDGSVMLSAYRYVNNGFAATDMKTGRVLWSRPNGVPVGLDSKGNPVAVVPDKDDGDPELVSYDLRGGKAHLMGVLYTPGHKLSNAYGLAYGWDGSSLYAAGTSSSDGVRGLWVFEARG